MNKGVSILVLLVFSLANVICLHGQEKTSSYLYFGATGGYSTLLGKVKEMSVPGFLEGGLHLGYELRHNHFLFRFGAEGEYYGSSTKTEIKIDDLPIEDTRSGQALLHYNMLSPLTEQQNFLNAGASLMMGYSANEERDELPSGGFYALLGVKVLMMCYESSTAKLKYETTASYERYIDDYEDMPNHYYTTKEATAKPKFGFWGSLFITADIGWEFNVNDYDKLKVGLFADGGLLNIMDGLSRANCHPDDPDVTQLVIDSYYRSDAMEGVYVVPLMIGVKVTYSLNLDVFGKESCNCLPRKYKTFRTHTR